MDGREPPYEERALAKLADRCSETERTAAEAERELVEWKKLKFMADHVGNEFAALIISTTKYGFYVELDEYFVEGFVPLDHIPGDRFEFNENTRRIVGRRSRQEYKIGDRLTVRLDRVNVLAKRLELSPVVEAQERRGSRNGKKTDRRE
jgi:ribonuclease R